MCVYSWACRASELVWNWCWKWLYSIYLGKIPFWDSYYIFWHFILTFLLKNTRFSIKIKKKANPCFLNFWVSRKRANKHLYLSTLCFSSPEIFTHVKRFILRAEDFISYWWPAAVLPLVVFLFSIPECDVLWSSWSYTWLRE